MQKNKNIKSKLLEELSAIRGIGTIKARKLISKGIKKVPDLFAADVFDTLSYETQLALKYPICENIPREVIGHFLSFLPKRKRPIVKIKNSAEDMNGLDYFIAVGSYRRGRASSSDIDLLTTLDLKIAESLLQSAEEDGGFTIIDFFSKGEIKMSALIEIYYSGKNYICVLDVFKTDADSLPAALLRYTGSKMYNIRLSRLAKLNGMLLNQNGIYKKCGEKTRRIAVKSEADILDILGVSYRRPSNRNK